MESAPTWPTETTKPRYYNPSFADEDADFIIRAGDETLFRVSKIILRRASDFFKSMLELPQPTSDQEDLAIIDGLPSVQVDESEQTLTMLLTLCYPGAPPEFDDICDLARVLKAAIKYEMHFIAASLRDRWSLIAASEPLRAFAIAYTCNLREEAETAARLSLQKPIWPLEPPLPIEFAGISAETLLRLESYHRKCAIIASERAADTTWCDSVFASAMCKHCQAEGWTNVLSTQRLHWGDWFRGYTRRAAKALLRQPSSLTVLEDSLVHGSTNPIRCNGMTIHEYESMQHAVQTFGHAIDVEILKASSIS